MRPLVVSLVLLGTLCASASSHAALWSGSNEVIRRGGYARMTVSLTGDGQTAGAEVEIQLPYGVTVVSATASNGAGCTKLSGYPLIRVVWLDAGAAPLPTVETPMCELLLRATSSANSTWLTMQDSYCVGTYGEQTWCLTDRGFLTVTP